MSFEIQTVDFTIMPAGLADLLLVTQQPDVQMIPLTSERIAQQHRAGWVALSTEAEEIPGRAVGYVGVTFGYRNDSIYEIGGLVVDPEQRGKGLGQALVTHATREVLKYPGVHPIAFCNPLSIKLFKKAGFQLATGGEVPSEAYEFCGDCRKQPGDGICCDLVLTLEEETAVQIRGQIS